MTRHNARHNKQFGPKPGSPMDRIVIALLKHGPMSEKEILATVGLVYAKPSEQRKAMTRSVNADWFEDRAGKYTLNAWLAQLIAERLGDGPEPEPVVITPPVYHPPFKPLAYDLRNAMRREPLREVSFMTGSTGFPVGYRI